jgi:hypothetical protein
MLMEHLVLFHLLVSFPLPLTLSSLTLDLYMVLKQNLCTYLWPLETSNLNHWPSSRLYLVIWVTYYECKGHTELWANRCQSITASKMNCDGNSW